MSLLTAWQFMIDLGHNEPNPVQAKQHQPVPLEGKTVLVNGTAGRVWHFVPSSPLPTAAGADAEAWRAEAKTAL